MRSRNGYDTRIVAFLDILGWRSLVSQSVADPETGWLLAGILRNLSEHYAHLAHSPEISEDIKRSTRFHPRREQDGWARDFQFAQFSDSIILSAKATRLTPAIFLFDVAQLCHRFFNGGVLIRGGITIGLMSHVDAFGFGPALTQAYDLESREARFPRVIIDPASLDFILGSPWTLDHRRRRRRIRSFPLIRRDTDGHSFLNFLSGSHLITRQGALETDLPLHPDLADPTLSIFEPARSVVEAGLKQFASRPRILEKYEWLARYYNDCAAEYQDYAIDLIAMGTIEQEEGAG